MPETAERAKYQAVDDAGHTFAWRKRDIAGMKIEQFEQIAAVVVTAGLVAGNFLMFTPWRNGEDPRQRQPVHSPSSKTPGEKKLTNRANTQLNQRSAHMIKEFKAVVEPT